MNRQRQDIIGRNNAELAKSTSRIIRDGSWKKQRIIVIIPAGDTIPARVALSHWNMAFPPNNGVMRILAQGMEVGRAYSDAIMGVLAHPDLSQWEYVLTIEHDNMPEPDSVLKLVKRMEQHREYACIGGLYWTKGEGGVPQIWGDPKDPMVNFRPQPPDPNGGLVECCGTGMGFNLWRLGMFKDKRIPRPWFETKAGRDGVGTQDLAFWTEARKHGYRCAIDCSVPIGHYDMKGEFGPPDTVW